MSDVLVLNAGWAPVDIITPFDAISKLYQEKVFALDAACRMYGWEEWIRDWSDAAALAKDVIRSPGVAVPIPRVVVLRHYKGFVKREAKCNRRNLYLRDKGKCQYCGRQGDYGEFNIDHVVPQCQGGRTVWDNVVLSCMKCNQRKRDRRPEEAGMRLVRQPFRPYWFQLKGSERVRSKFNSWQDLLSEMYWSVELKS